MHFLKWVVVVLVVILHVQECSGTCCNSDGDCPPLHCCVPPVRGRRSVTCSFASGRCEPYGGVNQGCHVGHRFTCPCLPGLTCVGTGLIEVPQGEVGNCQQIYG
ncbi:uncharacterized protein LOC111133230 [Crassostrea virginica]